MSFSPEWLALREPVDHASINADVRRRLVAAFAGRPQIRIVDLGAGAGSNLRGLAPWLQPPQNWTLVDYDPKLLEVAKEKLEGFRLPPSSTIATRVADLASGAFEPIIEGADLVTAAALFDLVSVPVIEKLAAACAARRITFATVLSYDGIAAWLPGHPLDSEMRAAFNQHQRGDKGFGAAAGPDATNAIAQAFARVGYSVHRGPSPWVVTSAHAAMRDQLDVGFAAAALETGRLTKPQVEVWLTARRAAGPAAVTIVGHEDIVCLPG